MLNCFPAGVYWGGISTSGIEQATEGRLQRLRFPAASGSSAITLPFDGLFRASINRVTINPCNPEQSASCCSGMKGEYNIGSWFTWTASSCPFGKLETSVGGKGEEDSDMCPVALQIFWQGSMIAATLNATSSQETVSLLILTFLALHLFPQISHLFTCKTLNLLLLPKE